MSTIEERLARDIAAVTGGVVVTDSDLRDARAPSTSASRAGGSAPPPRCIAAAAAAVAILVLASRRSDRSTRTTTAPPADPATDRADPTTSWSGVAHPDAPPRRRGGWTTVACDGFSSPNGSRSTPAAGCSTTRTSTARTRSPATASPSASTADRRVRRRGARSCGRRCRPDVSQVSARPPAAAHGEVRRGAGRRPWALERSPDRRPPSAIVRRVTRRVPGSRCRLERTVRLPGASREAGGTSSRDGARGSLRRGRAPARRSTRASGPAVACLTRDRLVGVHTCAEGDRLDRRREGRAGPTVHFGAEPAAVGRQVVLIRYRGPRG